MSARRRRARPVPFAILLSWLGVLAGCGTGESAAGAQSAALPATDEPEADAIMCSLHLIGGVDDDPGYEVLLRPGEKKEIAVASLRLEVGYDKLHHGEGGNFGLRAYAGEAMLVRILYQLRAGRPPRNEFLGGHGFTGLLYLTHPSEGGNYQAMCRSVDSARLPKRETREAYLERAGARARRKADLFATLHDAARPSEARAAAIRELHEQRERGFARAELGAAPLAGADLRDSDLNGARLEHANLEGALLYFTKLRSARLGAAVLNGANLYDADLTAAELGGAQLLNARLEHANFTAARMRSADLSGAYAPSARFARAELAAATFVGTNLTGADFTAAKLGDADLSSAKLARAVLDGADLAGVVNLTQAQLDKACGDEATRLPPGLRIRRGPRAPPYRPDEAPPCPAP